MKKTPAILFMTGFLFALSGCAAGDVIEQFIPVNDSQNQTSDTAEGTNGGESTAAETPTRVYMDEVRGTLTHFTGNTVTLLNGTDVYNFDISQATLECTGGMVCGDAISVIYEGQLDSTDTSSVKALKVVSTDPDTEVLTEQTLHAQIQSITANLMTVKDESGQAITFPVTGVTQYYQAGLKANNWVYIHYKGNLISSTGSTTQSGTLTTVISVSDIDPITLPAPTPTPTPIPEDADATQIATAGTFRGVIQSVSTNALNISIENTSNTMTIDMSAIPCYFSGGMTVGSHVTVEYSSTTGFNGTTTEGITILGLTGETPENLRDSNITFTYSGTVAGSTGNTVTVVTNDGAQLTCYTDEATNTSTSGLLEGSSIKITFNPAVSRDCNIFTAMKIQDV